MQKDLSYNSQVYLLVECSVGALILSVTKDCVASCVDSYEGRMNR